MNFFYHAVLERIKLLHTEPNLAKTCTLLISLHVNVYVNIFEHLNIVQILFFVWLCKNHFYVTLSRVNKTIMLISTKLQ